MRLPVKEIYNFWNSEVRSRQDLCFKEAFQVQCHLILPVKVIFI